MPRDYDNQASPSFNGGRSAGDMYSNDPGNSGINGNPFGPKRSQNGYGGGINSQSPFINAQQRSAPQPSQNGQDFVPTIINTPAAGNRRAPVIAPAENNYQDNGYQEDEEFYDSPDNNPDVQEQGTWSSEFNDFARISQQGAFNGRRNIADIFDSEQLQLYDRNKFSELHYLLQTKLSRHHRDLNTLIGMGLCSLSIGEPLKSAEYFAKATEIDETFRPSKYLNEVPAGDPDDWLDMAEELGHYGILDGALELCSSIVDSNKFSDRVRRQAMKVREAIQQDYFAARERIIIGSNKKNQKDEMRAARWLSTFTFIVAPLILAAILGSAVFYTINMNNGKMYLSHAVYRLDRLKKGNPNVERMTKCDYDLDDAVTYFRKAKKFNPFTKEAYFYTLQTAQLTKELGRVRSNDEGAKWDKARWQEAKNFYDEAKKDYDDLHLSTEKDLKLKNEWQNFVKEAKKEENAPL